MGRWTIVTNMNPLQSPVGVSENCVLGITGDSHWKISVERIRVCQSAGREHDKEGRTELRDTLGGKLACFSIRLSLCYI